MKIAKAFFALLFSVVLMAGQFSFATPSSQAKKHSACCGKPCCKGGSCCAKPADSNSSPIVPTRTVSQTDWQLAAAIAQHVVALINTTVTPAESFYTFVPSSSAVPIYQRHCSFLI